MTNTPFDEFWQAYPHKVGKKAAEKKYWSARKDTAHEDIMAGLQRYIETKPDWKAWCNPTTWLNQGRWEDEAADVQTRVADEQTIRERPQYLRRDNTPPELTEEEKARRKLRAEILEEMRREGLEPYELPDLPDQIRRRMAARRA